MHRRSTFPAISLLLILSLAMATFPAPLSAQQDSQPPFRIGVLEGDGAINQISQLVNRAVSVQVTDENHNALSGVSVTFFLPNDGPSGLFPNGSRVLTVFTDDKGVATSRSVRFNNVVGLMPIRVVATLFSQSATATVTQTNVSSSAAMRSSFVPAAGAPKYSSRPHSKKWVAVLLVLGVAAGGAYYFASRTKAPSATISAGAATVGTPTVTGP
ncbi:MAG: hypothetical protein ABSG79_03135 [Bryobacteraceae bacterium]|jgi:hypothetical protein